MDLIWKLLVCLVPIIVIIPTHIVCSVSMCQNETYTGTNYQISRVQNDPANCTCLLKSTEENKKTKVSFNMTTFNGCKYKLTVYAKRKMSFLSCTSTDPIFEDITSDIIKLNLEPNNRNDDNNTSDFILSISTKPETNLTLSCFVPKITKPSTTPFISTTTISTFSTSSESGISNRRTDSTKTLEPEQSTTFTRDVELNSTDTVFTTVHENPSSNSTVYYAQNTASPANTSMYSFSTITETEATTTNNLTVLPLDAASEQKYISEIVGGVIGCLVLVVIIIVIVCVIKGKRRKDRERKENGMSCTDLNGDLKMSERRPNTISKSNCFNGTANPAMIIRPNDMCVNVDSIQPPTFNTFNHRTPEIEIIENDLYVSSDSVPKDNSLDNRCAKMEIIENDLYVSSDSVRKDNCLDNICPKMEIIENDLYVSSDSVRKDNSLDNRCPKMEIIENDLYVSSDSIPKDNSLDNRCAKMEIIENDLYVSSDSIRKDNSLDSRCAKMEIIENDLYVSSDSVRKDNCLDNRCPKIEIIEYDLYVSSDSVRKDDSFDYDNVKPEIIENDLYVSSDSILKNNSLDNRCAKMEIIENDLYVSSDSIPKDNSLDNRCAKMEIIENDLYVSSDSILKDNSLDNRCAKMEIIENDLYVSSDSVRKAKSLDNHYAKSSDSVRENYPLGNGQSEPSSGNSTKHDPDDVNLADDIPKRGFVIIGDDCSVSSDPISEEDPNPFNESEKSKTIPHYHVVCPNCVAEEYEEYFA